MKNIFLLMELKAFAASTSKTASIDSSVVLIITSLIHANMIGWTFCGIRVSKTSLLAFFDCEFFSIKLFSVSLFSNIPSFISIASNFDAALTLSFLK